MDPFLLEGSRFDLLTLTLTFRVKVIPKSNEPNCYKMIASKLQMSLANGRVSVIKWSILRKRTRKHENVCQIFIFHRNSTKFGPNVLSDVCYEIFKHLGSVNDNKGSTLRLRIDRPNFNT